MFIAIGLWPFAWAVSVSAYSLGLSSSQSAPQTGWTVWALPSGFMFWVLLFFFLPRPFRTYVLGHELTHALWAIMMGGRVRKLKVGKKGGHVVLSKSNFIITLAPYFFPFYTVIVITLFYLAGYWVNVHLYMEWWLALIGLTWAFHITFTIHMLSRHQPDVHEHGRIFSLTIIYIMNVVVIAMLMVFAGDARFLKFGDLLGHETASAYKQTFQLMERTWVSIAQTIRGFN